ncbi:LysR substrate-binding domain-containing protein, partial [Klebsiella pneumoniae]
GVYGAADCLVGADGLSLSEADFVGWPETHQHLPAAQWITRTLRGRPCKVEANTLVAQVSAVSAGLGLGVLPHFMARASGLQCLQPEIGADQTLWLVMHSDLAGSRRVRVLADHLIALFADHQDRLAMP